MAVVPFPEMIRLSDGCWFFTQAGGNNAFAQANSWKCSPDGIRTIRATAVIQTFWEYLSSLAWPKRKWLSKTEKELWAYVDSNHGPHP